MLSEEVAQEYYQANMFNAAWIDTPLGPMIAIANETALYLLEFVDRRGLELEVERLRARTKSAILPGSSPPLKSIEMELKAYFDGTLRTFKTPLFLMGSPFQKRVWDALLHIPYGETKSYKEQAAIIEHPTATRAVANANGANQIAIVIPCHRVIGSSGTLTGFAGGMAMKRQMLELEKVMLKGDRVR